MYLYYSRGLAVLTFPFNLCANVALLSLKATRQNEDEIPSADVNNATAINDEGTQYTRRTYGKSLCKVFSGFSGQKPHTTMIVGQKNKS